MTQLPPVARSFVTFCKKCDSDKLHRVLTHVDLTSAKIECEICKKKTTFNLGETKATRREKKSSTKGASAASSKIASLELLWKNTCERITAPAQNYQIRIRFEKDMLIQHPKFGLGAIMSATNDRVQALFQDGERTLIHNQPS